MKKLLIILFWVAGIFWMTLAYAADPLTCARQKSEAAQKTAKRGEIRILALAGIACATDCLKQKNHEATCHYYRAVNRGLLLETNLANPKDHIALLVEDFREASAKDARYDDAGALRALGYIFLKLPSLSLWGDGYSRDLRKAEDYAHQALTLADDHPENLQLAGEIAFAQDDFKTALDYFKKSLKSYKKFKDSKDDYDVKIPELKHWIKKSKTKLKK